MPVPPQRDPELTRAVLGRWLTAAARPAEIRLGPITVPRSAGFSAEILLCDAEWSESGTTRTEPLVVRVAPTGHRVFPEDRWAEQVRLQALLAATDVPVPEILFHEPSGELLGAPFVVMRRVRGLVPADLPSYHREGWLADLPEPARAEVWWGGVRMLARLHRLDPAELGLHFLSRPEYGPVGVGQQLREYQEHLGFYGAAGNPVAQAALSWLREHRPAEPHAPRLLWGDARLGNIVFAGTEPAAVLDWEMAALGQPEADLAWFLHLDRHLSEGIGAERLPGLPGRAETVARYEELAGRPVRSLEYYEVFAAFRFCVATARVTRLLTESGVLPPGTEVPLHRNATALLDRVLAERAPAAAVSNTRPSRL
ncbi:aminoglycoside phosphotransferase (APT) family kinase protein [Kitasatospora sp. MAA4]|uniref:phosphotransferase family protein n=1 Tax=Kitasatospora sp. MAA4 TaxID=3035093 RepID=UPI00247685EF|nr:phosphotransferase family protein [Kitasatospora sp. MAA4]MDH6132393.1 aminoglycoside phosphotransferase (APT) family kinase protein [Kitasatospora sp. MAA4]